MNDALLSLCAAAAAGALLVSLSGRLRIPPIVLLLLGGVALGPEGLALVDPMDLGAGLKLVVGMTVAVILFEGGLTLDFDGARQSTGAITRMLTIGVMVTWAGASLTVWLLFNIELSSAVLCGSLVVVTGPTVVAPILRRLNVQEHLKHILFWESVLVDAIGVFLAVLCFEWISPDVSHGSWSPLIRFATRTGAGIAIGTTVGLLMALALRRRLIQDEHVNIVVLGVSLVTFAIAEAVLHETGVLAVIIAGFCLGVSKPRQLKELKRFKLELTELGVGTLFILLAGTLRLAQFQELGWPLVLAVMLLTIVIRPLAVLLSTWGQGYRIQEKVFLSWIAPRGIVAAFLASLFALELGAYQQYAYDAQVIHTFTFAVIGATVIVQGLSAPAVARLLRLEKEEARTWLVIAQRGLAAPLIRALQAAGVQAIGIALQHGDGEEDESTPLLQVNPLDRDLRDQPGLQDVAEVLVISPNLHFNDLVCERWADVVGPEHCHHWSDASVEAGKEGKLLGVPRWTHAGRPSEVATRIENGTLAIVTMECTGETKPVLVGSHLIPLIRVRGKEIAFSETSTGEEVEEGETLVVLRKRLPGLGELIQGAIRLDGEGLSFEDVIGALLERASQDQGELPVDELRELIADRERGMSTAVGAGVSIPHAYHDALKAPRCYLASIPKGMSSPTPDGKPVRLTFLVLSPSEQAESHLKRLAIIASLCEDEAYLDLLSTQPDESSLLRRIEERA